VFTKKKFNPKPHRVSMKAPKCFDSENPMNTWAKMKNHQLSSTILNHFSTTNAGRSGPCCRNGRVSRSWQDGKYDEKREYISRGGVFT
jgi:hypothetical protein